MKKFIVIGAVAVVSLAVSVSAYFKVVTFKVPSPQNPLGAIEFRSGTVTSKQLDETVLQRRTVFVTAAQIDDLQVHPVVLIPSPGTGKAILVQEIVGFRQFSSESWSRGASNESFEVKWAPSQIATGSGTGMAGAVSLGASFSAGFLTGNGNNTTASPSIEVWTPGGLLTDGDGSLGGTSPSASYEPVRYASTSAVQLTGLVNPSNAETSGITNFIFEVVYRILPLP